jgi:hypothetical protein
MYILSSLRRLLEAAMQDDQDTHEARKAQHPRWKFNFTNPGDSIGITPDAPVWLLDSPVWLLVLVELVFFKGRALVHGIDFFLRIWQPHAQEEDCRAWAFKLITANGFERSLRNAGLPVTSWPTPGDAPIAGPCQADRGLTDGRHGMDAVVYGADEPIIRRYDYPDGVYWEVRQSCHCFQPS